MGGLRHYNVLFVLAGFVLGFLVLHPYVMLVQLIVAPHSMASSQFSLSAWVQHFFDPLMLPMGIAFALFGGAIGFLVASGMDRERRLLISRHEKEKREIALRTVHNLMVTLSHYLLNANMIIGGKVRHCRKITMEPDVVDSLKIIEEQGRKIDAVLKVLRSSVEINTSGYTTDGLVAMIDISKELAEQLRASEIPNENS